MKKRIIILISVFIGLVVTTTILYLCFFKTEDIVPIMDTPNIIQHDDFVYIDSNYYDLVEKDNYIIESYEDFKNIFDSDKLSKDDFDKNNYAVVIIKYDQCLKEQIAPVDYEINGEDINVIVKYKASCGLCAPENMYYLLKIDKSIIKANIKIDYKAVNTLHCNPNVLYKPLIYLYPEEEMDINVKLGYKELLTVTYPKYNDGWSVHAYPNGNLIDENNKTYYGLYWEGNNYIKNDFEDGFVVKGSDSALFLEDKLSYLGLNEREMNEFIIFWLPKLEENNYNLIRFENIDVINKQMPLTVKPNPDTIIRVLMEFKPLKNKINIKEQKLTEVKREGFTVVEWGGTIIK